MMELNRLVTEGKRVAEPRNVHLLGICGTAMTALADCMQQQGFRVTGSDEAVYPPMSERLAALGIAIREGYRAGNIPDDTDLVVVGNVMREANPEAVEMRRRELPHLSMAEALRKFAFPGKEVVVVAGTHGKTTTTALLAHLLTELGAKPGFLVGGIPRNFDGNFRLGAGRHFVIEGDEYDTAYFDKTPKFFKFQPRVLIVTSLEFDHGDIFPDLETIRGHFRRLIAGLPADGLLIACADDPEVRELAREAPCPVIRYGRAEEADLRLQGWKPLGAGGKFETLRGGKGESWRISLPGLHNGLNALVAIALGGALGFPPRAVGRALRSFRGVKRRQEIRGRADGVTVIDDFAHHPTAVRVTIEAIRGAYPGRKVWAVFEPRSFTARSPRFQEEFGAAFLGADRVVLAPPHRPAGSGGAPVLDTGAIAAFLQGRRVWALAAGSTAEILELLTRETEKGDVVLIMSNGGFEEIHQRLLDSLAKRGRNRARRSRRTIP